MLNNFHIRTSLFIFQCTIRFHIQLFIPSTVCSNAASLIASMHPSICPSVRLIFSPFFAPKLRVVFNDSWWTCSIYAKKYPQASFNHWTVIISNKKNPEKFVCCLFLFHFISLLFSTNSIRTRNSEERKKITNTHTHTYTQLHTQLI